MPAPVFYSVSMYGTGSIETGAGTITIASGVATLSVEQTSNVGVGVEIEYNSLHAYIAPNRIAFDSGGTTELLPDTKIEGGTSGATGIVRFVEVTSGTWAGGDAAGWIYFEKTTGTFQNNEQINRTKPTTSNNIATVNGTIEGNIGNGNTEFVVKTATGGTPANQTATAVTSIHHVWATLSALEGAFTGASYINNASLVTADVVAHACCYYDHDDQTVDTAVVINYGTDDATRYLYIFTPTGNAESINNQRHSGVWDANKYLMVNTATVHCIENTADDYTQIEGIQAHQNDSTNYRYALLVGDIYKVHSCIFRGHGTAVSVCYFSGASGTGRFFNNVFYDAGSAAGTNCVRTNNSNALTLYFYNNTLIDGLSGFLRANGTVITRNSVSFNATTAFSGTFSSSTYNAYDSGADPGSNGVDISAEAGTDLFEDYNNDNFDVKDANSALYNAGTSLLSDANLPVWRDIAGNERGATPDIGAFEYVAVGGTTVSPNNISLTHNLDTTTAEQTHYVLASVDIAHSHNLDTTTIEHNYELTAQGISHSHNLDTTTVTIAATLIAQDISHSYSLDVTTVDLNYELTAQDASHTHSLDTTSVVSAGALSPVDISHTHSLDIVTLTQANVVAPNGISHSHFLDTTTITAEGVLTAQDISHTHSLDETVIEQTHYVLTAQDISHTHSFDTTTVGKLLSPADISHTHSLDVTTAEQSNYILVAQDISHSHSFDIATVEQSNYTLETQGASHTHSLDTTTAGLEYVLVTQDIAHPHSLDTTTVEQKAVISPSDLSYSHSLDATILVQYNTVSPNNISHTHSLDTATVTTGVLDPRSISHTHSLNSATAIVGGAYLRIFTDGYAKEFYFEGGNKEFYFEGNSVDNSF